MNKKFWCVCFVALLLGLSACGDTGNSPFSSSDTGSSVSTGSSDTGSSSVGSSDTASDSSSTGGSDTGSDTGSSSSESTQTVTIYYDLGDCPNATIPALTQSVRVGDSFTLYVPYLDESKVTTYGYDFIKWLNKADNSEFTGGICDFTQDVYLIAVWEKCTPDIPL